MNDANTTQPTPEVQDPSGHGRHRGPVADQDGEATPQGRHRRPVEHTESAA